MADFSISAIIKAIDGVTAPVGRISQSFKSLGASAKRVGIGMSAALTLPTVAFGATALRTTVGFQQSMNKVGAVMDLPAEKMRELELLARKMGAATVFSATDSADAMVFLAQAGLSTENVMASLPGTLQLAAAGGLDMATAADLATNVLAGMRMEVGELGRVNDVLAKGASSSNTSVQELAEALKVAGPVAAGTNVGLEETVSILGVLANAGFKGEEAGTAFRNMLARLVKPATDAQEVMVKLGITSRDVVDEGGNIKNFTALMNKMRTAGASAADMITVFGLRAGPQTMAALGQGAGAFEALRAKMENADGTAKRMADRMMTGLPGAIEELSGAFEEFQLSVIASGIGAAIGDVLHGVTGFIRSMAEANPAMLKWGAIIVGAVAVIGPLVAALGFIAIGIGAVLTPIGILVMAIGGFIAISAAWAAAIYANWGGIESFFADLWDGITAKFQAGWDFISGIVDKITAAASAISNPLGLASRVGNFVGGLFGGDDESAAAGAAGGNAIPGAIAGASAGARGRDATARVQVEFPNAPPGMRVQSDVDGDGLDLGVETGQQFAGAF